MTKLQGRGCGRCCFAYLWDCTFQCRRGGSTWTPRKGVYVQPGALRSPVGADGVRQTEAASLIAGHLDCGQCQHAAVWGGRRLDPWCMRPLQFR